MKVLCAIKRVVDYQVKIRIKSDGTGVETENVKMSMNPFDEIAVEEAIRWKEQGIAQEIIAVSIGDTSAQETLRQALALGADRAILIKPEGPLEPLQVAFLLKAIVERENPQVVIMGKQAIDNDCNQTGQMLAGLLDWSQGTFASKIEFNDNFVIVTREIDGGLETLKLKLPAIITTDLRLNVPRFASLPNIMKAKTKPLIIETIDALGVNLTPQLQTLHVKPPVKREGGVKINSIRELMNILKEKEHVLP